MYELKVIVACSLVVWIETFRAYLKVSTDMNRENLIPIKYYIEIHIEEKNRIFFL